MAGTYALTTTLTGLMYGFFAGQACTLNQFVTTANMLLCILATALCVHTAVQEARALGVRADGHGRALMHVSGHVRGGVPPAHDVQPAHAVPGARRRR